MNEPIERKACRCSDSSAGKSWRPHSRPSFRTETQSTLTIHTTDVSTPETIKRAMPDQSSQSQSSLRSSHDRRWAALLLAASGAATAAATAAALLLRRRRRLRRQAGCGGQQGGFDGSQQRANGAGQAWHPRDDLPPESSSGSSSGGLPPPPRRTSYTKSGSSGSLSDTYPAVDIGAALGVDIGGTLSKLVYFEKKAPSKADSKRRRSEDPMGKKVKWVTTATTQCPTRGTNTTAFSSCMYVCITRSRMI